MRNYVEFWLATELVQFFQAGSLLFFQINYNLGGTFDEATAAADNDRNIQLLQNQFQPPGSYYTFELQSIEPWYMELNKDNVLQFLDPSIVPFNTDVFVQSSPRETWSHGK